jgi:rhamnogalacturonyl hydrolase YesR
MKSISTLFLGVLIFFACNSNSKLLEQKNNQKIIKKVSNQLQNSLKNINSAEASSKPFPRSINSNGEIILVGKKDWTSGFYPGNLWQMYDLTGDVFWESYALKYTKYLEGEQFNASNHDIGFKMMSSYGHAYRITGDEQYKHVLIQSARTLITRFNENVGCIRSWDHHKDLWDFPVIIDNLMNLELLFWASKETGDPVFYNIAVKHAEVTMKNHFRSDFSSYHVVSYDTITGDPMLKNTRQGFSRESSWARGQAWALYGYTMIYRETQNTDFLAHAEKVANYIINVAKLPSDLVPYWDFNAPNIPKEPKDASAASVIASALFELASYSEINKATYLTIANGIMKSLESSKYLSKPGSNQGFLLKHSTGSKPMNSEIDVPLIYADYYFLEALRRKIELNKSIIL